MGSWELGIGDPSLAAWFTVLLYAAAAIACLRVLARGRPLEPGPKSFWRFAVVLLVGLGVNKQLDLQTALLEALRALARSQGWLEHKRLLGVAFVAAVGALLVGTALWLRRAMAYGWRRQRVVLAGLAGLLLFVLLRAAAFQRLHWSGRGFGDFVTHLLEALALVLVAAGAAFELRRRAAR